MLNYCTSCTRVSKENPNESCPYCNKEELLEMKRNSPVNVMGTKIKGKLFKELDETALLIVITENKEKLIKEYSIKDLRKIL